MLLSRYATNSFFRHYRRLRDRSTGRRCSFCSFQTLVWAVRECKHEVQPSVGARTPNLRGCWNLLDIHVRWISLVFGVWVQLRKPLEPFSGENGTGHARPFFLKFEDGGPCARFRGVDRDFFPQHEAPGSRMRPAGLPSDPSCARVT